MSRETSPAEQPSPTVSRQPRTWAELEKFVADEALAAGGQPEIALRDLRRRGAVVRMLCRQLGIEVPKEKRGPKPKLFEQELTVSWADGYKREGLKGERLWKRTHHDVATDEGLIGVKQNILPSALEQRYRRYRRQPKT